MDFDAIVQALARHPAIAEWTARHERRRGWQLYLIGTETECLRTVQAERVAIEIHCDRAGQRGTAGLVLGPADEGQVERRLDEAVFMAGLTANPIFRLPAPTAYPDVALLDPEIAADPRGAALRIRSEVLEAHRGATPARLAQLEAFVTLGAERLRTSAGVDAQQERSAVLVELTLVAERDGAEAESHGLIERRRLADLDLAGAVRRHARAAGDALAAQVPTTRRGPVLIGGEAVAQLFGPVVYHASAAARYREMSRLEPGRPVVPGPLRGEALTLVADATLPFGLSSWAFDEEGLPGRRVELVREGELLRYWATKRYADYLGVEPTGRAGNTVVATGAASRAELASAAGPTLEVEAFSWFSPDPLSGSFVAEVRLGYEWANGQRRPVKGGSVSGNLFEALGNARYSREEAFHGAYRGPAAVFFGELTVSGA